MSKFETLSDRIARATVERRRKQEAERQERIFNDKLRTIGVDKEALEVQVQEKNKQKEEEKNEEDAYDAAMLSRGKLSSILLHREARERREMEKAIVAYRIQHQQPQDGREFDLNDPDSIRKRDQSDAQMILPGLVGEDPGCEERHQRQREQIRAWLIQQQRDQATEREQQKLDEEYNDQITEEMINRGLQLLSLERERRKAATIATKDFNLARIEEKKLQKVEHGDHDDAEIVEGAMGVPGRHPSSDRKPPPETQREVVEFQKQQIEERKVKQSPFQKSRKLEEKGPGKDGSFSGFLQRAEMEKRKEEEEFDRIRLASARTALINERQQARLNKQLRQHLDNTNAQLAQTHKEQEPDIERGHIDQSFFSKFNTCSR